MASLPFDFHIHSDDHILTLEEEDGDHFHVKFLFLKQNLIPDTELPMLTNFFVFFETSFVIPCEGLRDIPRITREHLYPIISDEKLSLLTPKILSYARSILIQHHRTISGTVHSHLLPLTVEVIVPNEGEDLGMDRVIQQSMQQVSMISATEKAVEPLKKVKVVYDGVEEKQCSICLEHFEDGEDASAMKCDHFYHKNFILPWLKESHTCPLCRCQMVE